MNAKQFLQWGGAVLVLVGILGYFGVIGPTAEQSLFGEFWWFDNTENAAHAVLGVVAILAAFFLGAQYHKPLVMLVGVVALFFAVWSGLISTTFSTANLEKVSDTFLHLVVGAWALWAAMRS